jgi:ParB-like chromosome segregation protein Spo0J
MPGKESKAALVDQRYELVSVADLKPHPKNPRKGAAEAIDQSIAENGFYGAVVAQKATSLILAGRHRWERAQAAGIATLPVIWVDVDDQAALRILAADNRTSDLAAYDPQALAELLESVRTDGGGLEGTGYDAAAFDAMLQQAGDDIMRAARAQVKALHPAKTPSTGMKARFDILIECGEESQQTELLERFNAEGLKCRALIA